jgi:uncharacterized Zn finger protein
MDSEEIKEGDENLKYPKDDIRELSKKIRVSYIGSGRKHFFIVGNSHVSIDFRCTCENRVFEWNKPCKHILAVLRYVIRYYERLG